MQLYLKGKKVDRDPSQGTDLFGRGDAVRQELRRMIGNLKYTKILDVGTGFAINLTFLASLMPEAEIWSVDPSEETLTNARKLLAEANLGKRVTLQQASVESLPFENEFFDLVSSVMVLHHVNDVALGLRSMMRILGKRGVLAIIDWKQEAATLPFPVPHPPHIFVSPEEMGRLLQENGAEVQHKDLDLWFSITAKPR